VIFQILIKASTTAVLALRDLLHIKLLGKCKGGTSNVGNDLANPALPLLGNGRQHMHQAPW